MRIIVTGITFGMMLMVVGCSSVPGDAALRSGHPEQAAELYRRGAEQGDPSAALRLGLLLDEGSVSAGKFGEAGEWFKRACSLGRPPACHNVGVAFEYGKNGLSKDLAAAHEFYLKAANSGYMQSQYNLASMHSNNYISPQDDVEGLKWMLLAQISAEKCKQNQVCEWILDDPPGHKRRLESRLSETQRKAASELVVQWRPQQ